MPFLRALLSALTLFGGHFLNRRLDRVVVVFAALTTLVVVSYFVFPTLIFSARGAGLIPWAFRAPAVMIIAIALASATMTWGDAKSPAQSALSASAWVAGSLVSLFGFMLLSVATLSLLASPMTERSRTSFSSNSSSSSSRSFTHGFIYASSHLGGFARTSKLEPPPSGSHPLRGRILRDGRPAEGAEVKVMLNATFQTDELITNEQGEFEVRLPPGKWFLNEVTVTRWQGASEDQKLLLFSEYEPAKGTGYYSRRDTAKDTGLEFTLPQSTDARMPTFELRDAILVNWPARTARIPPVAAAPVADIATAAIAWQAVPAATEYEIQLNSVTRKGDMTSYESLLLRRQADSSLRLADLPQHPRNSAQPAEYSITIFAFDSAGKLLSETAAFGEYNFSLAGDVRLAEEAAPRSATRNGGEYFRNMERLSLVSGLLEYKQVDAARTILNDVTDDAPPGRKAAMQGAIEALAGNCAAALPLFDQADAEGGAGCAPGKYRLMCAPPP